MIRFRRKWALAVGMVLVSLPILGCSYSGALIPFLAPTASIPVEPAGQTVGNGEISTDDISIAVIIPATSTITPTSTPLDPALPTPKPSETFPFTKTPTKTIFSPSRTGTSTFTPTMTFTRTSTWTPSRTSTLGSVTPGWTPAPSETRTSTFTRTGISSPTASRTPSATSLPDSATPSETASFTPTRTPTVVSSLAATQTGTATSSPTSTPTIFPTPVVLSPTPTMTYTLPPSTPTTSVCSPVYNGGFESQIIALINIERANQGLSPLSSNGALVTAARSHSTDMAVNDFFSHTGSDGSSFWDRILRAGYSPSSGAENIAAGYGSPEAVVAGWMGSDGHRANLLGDYVEIGIGYAYCANSQYGNYWTADFGSPPD